MVAAGSICYLANGYTNDWWKKMKLLWKWYHSGWSAPITLYFRHSTKPCSVPLSQLTQFNFRSKINKAEMNNLFKDTYCREKNWIVIFMSFEIKWLLLTKSVIISSGLLQLTWSWFCFKSNGEFREGLELKSEIG